ncbi:MAG: ABC transporter permease [Vicinamibacterales bacterium]
MLSDLALAFRQLRKSPLVTLAAVASLALALGANTALFSIFNRLVLRPHPSASPIRCCASGRNNPARNFVVNGAAWPRYELLREQQKSFTALAASAFGSVGYTRDGGEPEQLQALRVTHEFLPVFGLEPVRGRNFTPDDDRPGAGPVAVISHEFWQTRLGGRENVVGESIALNGLPTTIVGILPAGLGAPLTGTLVFITHAWEPPSLTADQVRAGATYLQLTGRLKPGVSLAQANQDLAALSARYKESFATRLEADHPVDARTLTEELAGNIRPTLRMLLGAVLAVLLIAVANISNLFLARLSSRQKEVAVRLSLGATRAHLIRQFLLESAVFAAIATLLGLALGRLGLTLVSDWPSTNSRRTPTSRSTARRWLSRPASAS